MTTTSETQAPLNEIIPARRPRRVASAVHFGGKPHLLLLITEDWYYWSHRRSIATAAREAGFRVTLATRFGKLQSDIAAEGVETLPIQLRRRGRNPIGEVGAVADLARQYGRIQPDIVHHVSLKPVLYGSWAARLAGVRGVVNAISGFGYALTGTGAKAGAYRTLATVGYRSVLRRPGTYTIFQNEDDQAYFVDRGLLREKQAVLIRGSGVDLDTFRPKAEPEGIPTVLYVGRMLWSKGVGDLAAAVPLLRSRGHEFNVVLIGHSDVANPEAISPEQLHAWEAEGLVKWWGRRDDVAEVIANSHVVVLASEREGVPKALLEAAGAGKPLVATDVPGNREVVEPGQNGFLVPVHDADALADALGLLISDAELRGRMGSASRRKAEAEFSEEQIVGETLALYEHILSEQKK